MNEIDTQSLWLTELDDARKLIFLAALGHALTVVGRNSYEMFGSGVDEPEQLRLINEIMHRVMACMHRVALGKGDPALERVVASWVLGAEDPSMGRMLDCAWRTAKDAVTAPPAAATAGGAA